MVEKWTRSVVDSVVRVPFSRIEPIFDEIDKEYSYYPRDAREPERLYSHNEDTGEFILPRSAMEYFDDLEDERTYGRRITAGSYVSKFIPREGQEDLVRNTYNGVLGYNGGVLHGSCGIGKTICGAEFILRRGLSACILVHAEHLADQWEVAFRILDPNITVGRMQRDRCDTGHTHDVVVAITQSVVNSRREYPKEAYSSYGVVVGDEVHRYGSEIWKNSITKFPARYRLGLTATPDRADGHWPVIKHHIGNIVAELIKEAEVIIHIRKVYIQISPRLYDYHWLSDIQKRAKLITILSENEERNQYIAKDILPAIYAGRRNFVISDRRSQLDRLYQIFKSYSIDDDKVGFYVGGKSIDKLKEAATKPVILATYKMASEGLNIPELDCCFLVSPRARIQQTIGRIVRELQGKKTPKVIDYADINVPLLKGLMFGRIHQYKKLGYKIE